LRYWEIPCTGSLLLAQKPRGPVPDNFVHGHEAVFVQDDLSDLVEQVNYYCDHDEEREKIAAAGRQKFLQHHTTVARARYVLDALKERRLFSL
jgi:spore maturation protein CgeB